MNANRQRKIEELTAKRDAFRKEHGLDEKKTENNGTDKLSQLDKGSREWHQFLLAIEVVGTVLFVMSVVLSPLAIVTAFSAIHRYNKHLKR